MLTFMSCTEKIASNIEQASEEYIPKIWNILSQGVKGLLSPLAGIISPIVELLKNLGNSFIEGVQSIFSKPLAEQEQAYLNVAKNVAKNTEVKVLDQSIGRPNKELDNAAATSLENPKRISNVETAKTTTTSNINPMIDNMRKSCTTIAVNNIAPPPTPANKQGPSHTIQR